ncbi:MAG: S41 family peptidase [Provencibacterium sp.]|jgi:carboxyl-terminal processing protease|nr:S41 family peptidase [Provencibacterium sp.]
MNKKISLGAALAMLAIVAAATFSITMVYSRQTFNNTILNIKEREATYSKLAEIDKWARQKFFGTINEDTLNDSIAQGYIAGLGDPYARYYTVEEYTRLNQSGASKSVGVGIVTELDETGYILITEVYPDSPALAAGIAAGDLIVKIDETDVTADNAEEMSEAIFGDAGTQIDLTIRRDNADTPYPLTRRDVEKPSVYSCMTGEGIGYMQILEFGDNTADQFTRAVDRLVSEGAQALVFDVRNNQGGKTEPVTRILDKLLPQGTIVSATYKDGTTEVLATSDPACINLPMVVIMNEKTASAAELFAQALKDKAEAQLVGLTTLGKGTMQQFLQLNDGSAISVTVAKYNPPTSPNYDGIGVKPDFEVKVTKDQADLISATDKKTAENLLFALETDPQLKKSLELAITAANVNSAGSAAGEESASSSAEEQEEENSGEQEE